MKKIIFALLFLLMSLNLYAQLGAQISTSSNAKILKRISLQVDSIQFGAVQAGGGQTYLNPISYNSSSNIGFNSRLGKLLVDATPDEPIRIEFSTTISLLKGSDSITYKPTVSAIFGDQNITHSNTLNSVLCSADSPVAGEVTATSNRTGFGPYILINTENGSEKTTLFIGGYLYEANTTNPVPVSQPTGSYRGVINFNVIYNN